MRVFKFERISNFFPREGILVERKNSQLEWVSFPGRTTVIFYEFPHCDFRSSRSSTCSWNSISLTRRRAAAAFQIYNLQLGPATPHGPGRALSFSRANSLFLCPSFSSFFSSWISWYDGLLPQWTLEIVVQNLERIRTRKRFWNWLFLRPAVTTSRKGYYVTILRRSKGCCVTTSRRRGQREITMWVSCLKDKSGARQRRGFTYMYIKK